MVLGIPVVILSQGSQSREKNEDFCRMALERSLTWSAKPQGWFSVAEEEFPRSRVGKILSETRSRVGKIHGI